MNTARATACMEGFLRASPRPAVEVRAWVAGEPWLWRSGAARPVADPVFEIGSVGKIFTTTLLALLVERGTLRLSDPVARFFPGLPWGGTVSLQQLASHASGLPANPFSRWQLLRRGRQLAENFSKGDLLDVLRQLPPKLPAGRRARYSNLGMALLGRILGEVCGSGYSQAVQELILQPLDMLDTHIDPERYPVDRLMTGHDARGRVVPPFVWPGMEPAGVWRSTGADMMKFLRAHLEPPGRPWEAVVRMTTQPRARARRNTQVGLGWMLNDEPSIGPTAWHNGGTFGQHSMAAWAREQPAAVIILTNRTPPWWHHLVPDRQLEQVPGRLMMALGEPGS